ncbi:tRNA (adenosine(37)-N6)-threonylcarbamoyltransferase complex dimerization subunit type 1 TsaB [Facklamia miroungae]|uniref:tRNA threonylcarbamoyladenosine biosynthesis protein TsaB n=1 Tax=Facklamia miroungae TaxID=120956 RepID=A0A1G7S0M1_9LACT|nr:tRNA (adenosine(37)-N6)-threonylcarbamoyltransferase complex dimerization subunit type 1 TsaB [Facklamia miroungae]NKZ29211.1 tRNA (adenosine(37)-N6)-threonylcarbamoyltransferase complex dimerization subunit type 1 TsaB [Facklamia miroungae]SDG16494.1 tRNA threonylcarbamoyladenosine biosynthesis protein TsaB [Facklamia miroungae]
MRSLALDTSSDVLSLGLFEEGQLIIEVNSNVSKQHGAFLLPLVENLLHSVHWKTEEIDCIWLGRGPGSYTGLRIGATMAKVWASTKNCQLESFSSLAILAAQVADDSGEGWIVPLIDARRGTAYTGVYQWQEGLIKNQIKDQHVDWQTWIEDTLLPEIRHHQVSQLIMVSSQENELTDFIKERLSKEGVQFKLLLEQYAWPKVGKTPYIEKEVVEDVDVFEPFYAHLTLAEQEWAAKQSHKEKNESYVEQTNETRI